METRRGITSTFVRLLAGGLLPGSQEGEEATPERVIAQSAAALAAAMALLHGGQWLACIDHEAGFILIQQRVQEALVPIERG